MFVLINPKSDDDRNNTYPLGLAYIAAGLEPHGKVRIFDLHYGHTLNELMEYLFSENIRFIGLTLCTSIQGMVDVTRIARLIKELNPSVIVGIGGPHATFQGHEMLQSHIEFDVMFIGAGEVAIRQLGANLARGEDYWYKDVKNILYRDTSGNVVASVSAEHDMSCIPLPARHLLPSAKEYSAKNNQDLPVMCVDSSRGCHGSCTFCTFRLSQHKPWQPRDLGYFKADILSTISRENVDLMELFLTDADFFASPKRADDMLNIIMDIPQIKGFPVTMRADSIVRSQHLLSKLFKAGCNFVEVGIESNADSQLKRFNKRTSPETNLQALDILTNHKKSFDFGIQLDIIFFEPYVTMREIRATNELVQKYSYGNAKNESVFFHKMRLFSGTEFRRQVLKDRLSVDSYMDAPHWEFENEDVARFYSFVVLFKNSLYRDKKELQKRLSGMLRSKKIDLRLMKDCRYLSTMCYDYFNELLNSQNSEDYKFIYSYSKDYLKELSMRYDFKLSSSI